MRSFTLEVTEQELNIVSTGLTELPYKSVAELIGKLQGQINTQMQPPVVQPVEEPQND